MRLVGDECRDAITASERRFESAVRAAIDSGSVLAQPDSISGEIADELPSYLLPANLDNRTYAPLPMHAHEDPPPSTWLV